MRPESFIAARLFAADSKSMSSAVVRIAVLSVTLGLAVMTISVAVVIGFKNQIREKVTGFTADVVIKSFSNNMSAEATPVQLTTALAEKLDQLEGIKLYHPVAEKGGIVRTGDAMLAVFLKGVEDQYLDAYIKDRVVEGSIPSFADTLASSNIVISKSIADKLQLQLGQTIRMWFVDGEQSQVRGRRFIVSGIYETGLVEFDDRYIFSDIRQVQKLYNWSADQYGAIEVRLQPNKKAADLAGELYFSISADLDVRTAEEMYPHIFDWLGLQDMNVWIIIGLMVMVSGITVVSTLLIIILERTSTIGLLKSMGADNRLIRRIFLIRSYKLLLMGMLWGNVLALAFVWLQSRFGFLSLPEESYYLSKVPVELGLLHFLLINIGVFVVWSSALIIPVSVVNRIQPSSAIRYS